jgi:cilia- and flagella-associated protein 57
VIAGDSGQIRVFFRSDVDTRMPYKRAEGDDLQMSNSDGEPRDKVLLNDVMYHKITNMAINPKQDTLLFTTDANQILKVQINLERPYEVDKFEYMITSFHSKGIVGLDVCVKKQILATCATDRTVRIWSYNQSNHFNLDLCQQFTEETYSLAIHPSGFHLVVGFGECIKMMNILNNALVSFKSISIKNCREIQFSHGGSYFAAQNGQNVNVYKFYTGETSNDFFFKGHSNFIKSISWLEDDSGFVTCGWDSSIYLWKLY